MDLLAVEGVSGEEGRVAELVREKLIAAGCSARWIGHDRAHKKIGSGWQVGNLIVKIPGTVRAPRRLFSGHLDTVPLCRGAVPVRRKGRIESKGETALGGDNRTAVGAIVTMVEVLLASDAPRPPITLLLTVGEEVGLRGAREVDPKRLGNPAIGFNVDGGDPAKLITGAIGADRWEAHVYGRSSHAGVHPEEGVSSIVIASRAIADVTARGFFGKVSKGKRAGASNVGVVRGGETTNQVTDYVYLKGECRSHSAPFLRQITAAYERALQRAARSVKSVDGITGRVEFEAKRDYDAFRMSSRSEPVQRAMRALGSSRSRRSPTAAWTRTTSTRRGFRPSHSERGSTIRTRSTSMSTSRSTSVVAGYCSSWPRWSDGAAGEWPVDSQVGSALVRSAAGPEIALDALVELASEGQRF